MKNCYIHVEQNTDFIFVYVFLHFYYVNFSLQEILD